MAYWFHSETTPSKQGSGFWFRSTWLYQIAWYCHYIDNGMFLLWQKMSFCYFVPLSFSPLSGSSPLLYILTWLNDSFGQLPREAHPVNAMYIMISKLPFPPISERTNSWTVCVRKCEEGYNYILYNYPSMSIRTKLIVQLFVRLFAKNVKWHI